MVPPSEKFDPQEFFDSCPDYFQPQGSCYFSWSVTGIGFGELGFYMKDGKLTIMNEGMSKEWIKQLLCKAVDNAMLED